MFLDCQIDSIDFLGGPKAFLDLVDGQLTTLRGLHHDFWKMPKKLHPYYKARKKKKLIQQNGN